MKILGLGIGIIAVGAAAAILIFRKKDDVGKSVSGIVADLEDKQIGILPFVSTSTAARSDISNLQSEATYYREIEAVLANPLTVRQSVGNAVVYSPSQISSAAATVMSREGGSYVATSAPSGTTLYRRV